MPAKRTDVTGEKCRDLYSEVGTLTGVAERLNCSVGLVRDRLLQEGVSIKTAGQAIKDGGSPYSNKPRQMFNTKEEQAHYICTHLRGNLAKLLEEIRMRMER